MLFLNNLAILAFAGGEGGSPLSINPGVIIWTTITFLLLLFVLKKTAWKPILDSLDEREKKIKDSLEEAERARQEAEKLIAENQANLAKAEEEAQKIIEQSREYAETLKSQIIAQSKEEAKKILEDAQAEIKRRQKESFAQLKREVADIAVEAAEKIIKTNLDKQKQIELVNKHIDEISKN
jgi:F-type H+-transporting ATPase subunit b